MWGFLASSGPGANLEASFRRGFRRQPGLEPQERIAVLTYLKYQDGITPADMRSEYERLIAAQPENWKLSAAYVEYLQEFRDWEKAREVTQAWIDRKVTDTGGFDHIFAHTTLARLYYRQRRYSEGLEAVEPVVESGQFGALKCKALLLDRLGRKEEAMTLGQRPGVTILRESPP